MPRKIFCLFFSILFWISGCENEHASKPKSPVKSQTARSRALSSQHPELKSNSSSSRTNSKKDVTVGIADDDQRKEVKIVTDKIANLGIRKYYIFNYKKGALKKIMGANIKKIIVMNSAGKNLYNSSSWFRDNSFAQWEFNPYVSKAVDGLKKLCEARETSEEYQDDILYILWDGLEFELR